MAANGTASQIKESSGFPQRNNSRGTTGWAIYSFHDLSKAGIRAGQKWETSEPETDPSPIAVLSWTKNISMFAMSPACPINIHKERTRKLLC
jgi:hypothetical protein